MEVGAGRRGMEDAKNAGTGTRGGWKEGRVRETGGMVSLGARLRQVQGGRMSAVTIHLLACACAWGGAHTVTGAAPPHDPRTSACLGGVDGGGGEAGEGGDVAVLARREGVGGRAVVDTAHHLGADSRAWRRGGEGNGRGEERGRGRGIGPRGGGEMDRGMGGRGIGRNVT